MTTTTLIFRHAPEGVLTDVTSAVLSDAQKVYGVLRTDTYAIIVAADTPMTKIGNGVYSYDVTDPAADLTYLYVVKIVYLGETYYLPYAAAGSPGVGGSLVTLVEAKAHIRITTATVDDQVQLLIEGVESYVAAAIGSVFVVTSYAEYCDGGYSMLAPTLAPVVAIASIVDTWDEDTVLDAAEYRLVAGRTRLQYLGTNGGSVPIRWPAGRSRYLLTYTAGYNDGDITSPKPTGSTAAPVGLKLVVLGLIRRVYELRGGQIGQAGQGFSISWDKLDSGELDTLLRPYKFERMV